MSLSTELSQAYDGFHSSVPPDISQTVRTAASDHKASYDPKKAIQVGDQLPKFELPDINGKTVTSDSLLAQGPLLISFFRGEWCPFCSLELKAVQKHLADFQAKGTTLVAISPELSGQSQTTTEKHDLKFPVLSDVGAKYARQLNLVFEQPESLRSVYKFAGIDWEGRYGSDSLVVPVPATLLVDRNGKVRNIFVDANFAERLEPETALGWIDRL